MQYVRIDNNFVFNNCYRRSNAKPVFFLVKIYINVRGKRLND